MLVLGIDPGTINLGWGVVLRRGQRLEHVAHGVLALDSSLPLAQRLRAIDEGLAQVIERHSPQAASVESLFFHKDAQAAAKLGHARGVVLLALARADVPIFEYAPTKVKLTVAGRGQATKDQVAAVVRAILSLRETPPPDAADALAIAMTHMRSASSVLSSAQALAGRGESRTFRVAGRAGQPARVIRLR